MESGVLEEDYFFSEWINKNFKGKFSYLKSEKEKTSAEKKFVGEVVQRNTFSAARFKSILIVHTLISYAMKKERVTTLFITE